MTQTTFSPCPRFPSFLSQSNSTIIQYVWTKHASINTIPSNWKSKKYLQKKKVRSFFLLKIRYRNLSTKWKRTKEGNEGKDPEPNRASMCKKSLDWVLRREKFYGHWAWNIALAFFVWREWWWEMDGFSRSTYLLFLFCPTPSNFLFRSCSLSFSPDV